MKSIVFENELWRIQNENLRNAVIKYFEEIVPEYFWTIASSMSGKYHSSFDAGEGGLVRHTKMCVLVAEELLRLEEFEAASSDIVYAAALMHDSFKHGSSGSHYRADHPRLAADAWWEFVDKEKLNPQFKAISYAVAWHSGQWSGPSTRDHYDRPAEYLREIRCVHLADYIASRSFFNKLSEF